MKNLLHYLSLSLVLATGRLLAQGNPDWHLEFPGVKIAGNLYHVGTADLAVYLVATPAGNIMINANFPQDLPIIRRNIEQLGFKYADTKILLISHAHGDHDAAVGQVKKETGARLMVMAPDVAAVESTAAGRPGAKVDRVLHDGDAVELGGAKLVARLTPGHTPGCTTWTMEVDDHGTKRLAVIVGSPNVNKGYLLVGDETYPGIAGDYEKAFATWLDIPAEIFLGAHGAYYGLKGKYAKQQADGGDPFVDPEGYRAYITERQNYFQMEWARQKANPGSPAP